MAQINKVKLPNGTTYDIVPSASDITIKSKLYFEAVSEDNVTYKKLVAEYVAPDPEDIDAPGTLTVYDLDGNTMFTMDMNGNRFNLLNVLHTLSAGTLSANNLTANKILVSDANKNIVSSGLSASDLITTSNISYQSVKDANYLNGVGGRVASANVSDTNFRYILASSAMTTGKPPAASKILHMGWDWDAWHVQIAYPTDVNEFYFRYKTDSAWQNWATWYRNGVPDIGNDKKTTFAYSKAGLSYTDYKWLAAWNGYELRGVNKSQFAAANHSHSYLPLSGGNLTGTVNINGDCSYKLNNRVSIYDLGTTVFALCANGGATVRRYDNANKYAGISANAFTNVSSRLIKKNIKNISDDEAKKILDLRIVDFDYEEIVGGEKGQIGLIAEETIDIFPHCVKVPDNYNEETTKQQLAEGKVLDLLELDYSKLVAPLIKMVQIQQRQIEELKAEVEKLKDVIES